MPVGRQDVGQTRASRGRLIGHEGAAYLAAFLLVLVYRAYQDLGTDNGGEMRLAEPVDDPLPPTGY